jgi:hypothetical protein
MQSFILRVEYLFCMDQEFDKLGPWITKFYIDGVACGGDFDASNDPRIDQFFQYFPDAKTILELGSLEGGHTFRLAERAKVLGLEGRQKNIDKALYMQKLLGIRNIDFRLTNLEEDDLSSYGQFDAVMCCGILYHMPRPWLLLKQISHITNKVFIWTHYAEEANSEFEGYPGCWYPEKRYRGSRIFNKSNPLSGLSAKSYWLTMDALVSILKSFGFSIIDVIELTESEAGKSVTLAAQRPTTTRT